MSGLARNAFPALQGGPLYLLIFQVRIKMLDRVSLSGPKGGIFIRWREVLFTECALEKEELYTAGHVSAIKINFYICRRD